MQHLLAFLILFFSQYVNASLVFQEGDWTVHKNIMTPVNLQGCVAETSTEIDVNGKSEKWVLQIVRLLSPNGEHGFPFAIVFPADHNSVGYLEAVGRSNVEDSPDFYLTLLQPSNGDTSIVASRKKDRLLILRYIRYYKSFTVNFLKNQESIREVLFSLKGSSVSIEKLSEYCP